MWLFLVLVGLLAMTVSGALILWGPSLAAPMAMWAQGFGAGALLGGVALRLQPAAPAPRPSEEKVYEAKGTVCVTCRRPLPAGVQACPFCAPVVPEDNPLGQTIDAHHEPLKGLVAMPGLANAARQTKESGAKGYLHVFTGKNKGESILIGAQAITIGRDARNALILKDEGVSQLHAEVRVEKDGVRVRDLGSRNGTFVNDIRVAEMVLTAGDVISVGETKMLFQG